MMNITYVTGCDSRYFLMTGILLQAFKEFCPGRKLWVCDFGLDNSQQSLLMRQNILLPRPSTLREHEHPWVYKSSLIEYIRPLCPDIVVWLDSDCFPVGPFAAELETLLSVWQNDQDGIALCRGKVGKSWQLASPEDTITFFGMQHSYPYYNSGVWALRSLNVLTGWADTIKTAPKKGMYEQDVFNYLLFKHHVPVQTMENDRWNVTHEELERLAILPDGTIRNSSGQTVLIIHITGVFTPLRISIGPFSGVIRALKKSGLKQLQIRLLKNWIVSIHSQ